jgi:hypothetical protein
MLKYTDITQNTYVQGLGITCINTYPGHVVARLVAELCYKPEGLVSSPERVMGFSLDLILPVAQWL